jgi:hypothetical protein
MRHWNPKLRAWMPGPAKSLYVLVILGCVLFMAAATQLDLTTQVKGILAIANGGTNTSSTLTGVVRGGASYTASELSGDCATSGSNVVTCAKVNSTTVPTNSAADQVLGTSASATGVWISIPNCPSGALNYTAATHTIGCASVLTGTFAPAEVPTGLINSSNVTYTLAHTPSPAASLELYKNGQQLIAGGADYTLATATITMVSAPKTGDVLVAYYRW